MSLIFITAGTRTAAFKIFFSSVFFFFFICRVKAAMPAIYWCTLGSPPAWCCAPKGGNQEPSFCWSSDCQHQKWLWEQSLCRNNNNNFYATSLALIIYSTVSEKTGEHRCFLQICKTYETWWKWNDKRTDHWSIAYRTNPHLSCLPLGTVVFSLKLQSVIPQ